MNGELSEDTNLTLKHLELIGPVMSCVLLFLKPSRLIIWKTLLANQRTS
jgi:hypothetical protein